MKSSTRRSVNVVVGILLVGLALPCVSAQRSGPPAPPLVISSMYGRDLFEFYCASCHGRDGTGHGPVVPALSVRVPDLTTLAARSGGRFPKARVASFVTGDQAQPTPAHGSKDMPVWGPIFRALDPGDTLNTVRIENIVTYVESLQVRKP